ncbi:MAG: hypothetical protein RIK87_15285 [Fuerstiella sp.]
MKKRLLFSTVLLLLITTVLVPRTLVESVAQDDPAGSAKVDKTERQEFMRGKLTIVHKIVEGISTEDFKLIKKGGMELVGIAESAAFKSTGDPFYSLYSANFEQAAKGLISAADAENIDKATFAYVHVTFSCTACHQHVRGTVRVAGP